MWRAYAGHGGGFCLEFEPELGASDFSIGETWFLRLSYGKEFPPRVRDLPDVVAVLLEETKDDPLVEFVATNRTRLVTMRLKHEAFSEEKNGGFWPSILLAKSFSFARVTQTSSPT